VRSRCRLRLAAAHRRLEGGLSRIFDVTRATGDPTEDGGLGEVKASVNVGCAQRSHRSSKDRKSLRGAIVQMRIEDVTALKMVPSERVGYAKVIDHAVMSSEGVGTKWCVAIADNRMYVALGDGELPEGVQSGFVGLLEYAERVGCTQMVVGVKKSRADLRVMLKTFMFFGFSPVAPNCQAAICSSHPDYVFLACDIDSTQLEA
jgi:hypothetical protein